MKGRPARGFFSKFGIAQPLLTILISAVSAFVGAGTGGFAFYKFYVYERAAYEPRASVSSTLDVRPAGIPGQCKATFAVELENKGVSAFDINETQVRVWAFDSKVIKENEDVTYIGLNQMQSKPLFDSADPSLKSGFETSDIPFKRHYAIGDKFNRTFEWLIRGNDAANFYFRVDFNPSDKQANWFTAGWSPSCSTASLSPPENKSPTPRLVK